MATTPSYVLGIANKDHNLTVGMRNFYVLARMALFCIAWLVGFEGLAQSRYWVGGSGNWSDNQHWSYASGGKGGAPVPTKSDVVFVDKNSFKADGTIALVQDVELGGLVWANDASASGLEGNYFISLNGILNYNSTKDWRGTFVLKSTNETYVSFPAKAISTNILFEEPANYYFSSGLITIGTLEVRGTGVNFANHKIKATQIIAPTSVKATAKSGFLKATQSDGGTFQVSFTVKNVTCPGGSDGSVSADNTTGGTGPYTYQWYNPSGLPIAGATTTKITDLKEGIYGLRIKDSKGIVEYAKVTILQPFVVTYNAVTTVDLTCSGASTGSMTIDCEGGTGKFSYSIDNGQTYGVNNPILNLGANSYTLIVKDEKGCTYPYDMNPVVISQPADIVLDVAKNNVFGCFGNANGAITVKATGGTAASPLECSIDGTKFFPLPDAGYTFQNLTSGPFTVTVRRVNDNSCLKTASVTIDQPGKLSATVAANPVTGCSVTPDGQIIVSGATGGSGSFEYTIDGGTNWVTTNTFTGLSANTYNVQMRDKSNPTCILILNAALQVTANPALTATVSSTNVKCNGANNGTITFASPQGGSGTYEYSVVLGTWVGSSTFTNLVPNTYTPQIRDKNNPTCAKPLNSVTITEPVALNATIGTVVDVSGCYNATNGSITVDNSSGGSGQYEYSVDGTTWLSSATISNLGKGTYAVQVRDKLSPTCIKPLGSVVVNAPTPITYTFTKGDITGCPGNSNGFITFNNTLGGSGTYDFSINNGISWQTSNSFNGLKAGSYTLLVRDRASTGCVSITSIANIIDVAPLAATVSTTSSCPSTPTGTIVITNPMGGSGTYKFSLDNVKWFEGPTKKDYTFQNLQPNTYTLYMQDGNSCSKTLGTYTVGKLSDLTATVDVKGLSGCTVTNNGAISVKNPSGAPSGIYEYSLDGTTWVSTPDFTNLAPGKYSVFIREKNSQCFTLLGSNYEVLPLTLLSITSTPAVDPTCFGGLTGSITVNASGGTAPLMYSDGGVFQAGNVFSNLAANSYVVTVKDAAGCTQTKPVTLNNPADVVPTITKVDIGCTTPTGQIAIPSVLGGKAPYTYSKSSGTIYDPSNIFTNLAAGSYKIRVKDSNGCESSITDITINSKPILDVVVDHIVDVKPCKGNSTGSIVLNVKSGTAPYKYKVGSGPLTDLNVSGSIDNLAAGKYDVTVVDNTNCTVILSGITVNEPAVAFSASYTKADVTACPDNGKITLNALGGGQPYSFSKDNGVTYIAVASGVTSYTFGNLAAGSYPIIAKDNNGCVANLGAVTLLPNSLALTATQTDILCKGSATGKIDASASNGSTPYQFAIDSNPFQGATSFNGLAAGSHTVRVKDAGGCIVSKSIIISEPATVVQSTVQGYDLSCNASGDGHITAQASGGSPSYTITLNPGNIQKTGVSSADFTGLSAGSYTVTVADSKCPTPVTSSVTLKEPAAVNITLNTPVVVQPSCSNPASITVTASATTSDGSTPTLSYDLIQGGSVIATNATGIFSNVASGSYLVKAYVGSCSSKTTAQPIVINNPLASGLTFKINSVTQISCFGDKGSVDAKVTGGSLPYGANVTVTVAGPSTNVTFDNVTGNVTANNLVAGSYTFTLNDGTCSQTQNVTINNGPAAALILPDPVISRPSTPISTDGSIVATATGGTPGYQYTLTPASTVNPNPSTTGTFGGLRVNTYSLSVVDSKGCTASKNNIAVTNAPAAVTADIVGKNILCKGAGTGSIDITFKSGLAPFSITVATTATQVAPITTSNLTYSIPGLAKGDYTVAITDANGTSITPVTITISEPTNALAIGISNATQRLCFGDSNGSMDVAVNGGTPAYTVAWSGLKGTSGTVGGTGGTISNLAADTYTIAVTDAVGCTANANQTIAANSEIIVVAPPVNPTCGGNGLGSITVTASGGTTPPAYTYSKDGSTFVSSGSFTNLPVGSYKVVVKDGVGCPSVPQQVDIKSPSNIVLVDPVQKTDAHCGVNGTITAAATGGSGDLTYNLRRSGKKDMVASNKTGKFIDVPAGKYFVEVTDGGTCPATSSTITIAPGGTSSIIEVKRNVDNILCSGGTGRFTVWVKGIVGTIQYDVIDLVNSVTLKKGVDYTLTSVAGVNPGEYTIILSDIKAGKYKLQVWDNNACPQSFAFAFTDPDILKIDSFTKVDPKSKTSNDGTIAVVVSGGTAPYVFSLYDESNNLVDVSDDGNFSGLAPGKYVVKVKGQGDCEVSTPTIELVAQSNLDFDNVIANDPNCHGETNGSIEVYVSGGVGKLQYSKDNGQTFQDGNIFSGLTAGVYDILVKDDVGVSITQQVTLKDPDAVTLTLVKKSLPSAGTTSDGSITVIASGGSGAYTISITDKVKNKELMNTFSPSVEVSFSNLQSSTYRIVAVDEKGCTAVLDPIVLERLSATATATDVTCGNATTGKIDVTIKGGTEPYKISWKIQGGTDTPPADVTGDTYTIKDLAAGKYIITVTDAAGGSVSITKTIKSLFTPIVATAAKVSDPICPEGLNGSIELAISGGKPAYTPTWTPETPSPSDPTGSYAATATGGVISGLRPSKYSINITDANGCSVVVNATVASTPAIVIESATPTSAKCNGDANGSITVKASGGVGELKYSTTVDGNPVENTTGQFDGLKAGKYTITVTDTKNCSVKQADVEVTEPAAIDLKVKEVVDQGCSTPGKITVEVANSTGKITYALGAQTNETGVFDGLGVGTYTITATNETGCSASVTGEVKSTASIKITKVETTNITCNGASNGKVKFDVEGVLDGLTVKVNGKDAVRDAVTNLFVVDNLPAGKVTIEANNNLNCLLTEEHLITEPEKLAIDAKATKVPANATDKTGEITVGVTGGTTPYSITCTNTATQEKATLNVLPAVFQNLIQGKYTIDVVDANGCTASADVTIGLPSITAKGISGNCKDPNGSIEVTITDGAMPYSVSYTKKGDPTVIDQKNNVNSGKVTFTGVPVGDYTVSMVDASGNSATPVDVNVPVYIAPTISLGAKCFLNNDYYIEIKVPDGLTGYTATCTDADGVAYTSFDPTTNRISKLLPNKTYTVVVADAAGCTSNPLTVDIATLPEMKVEDAVVTNVLCHGAATGKVELKATGGAQPLKYSLEPAGFTGILTYQDNSAFDGYVAGKYVARVLDAAGCYSNASLEITEPATALAFTLDDASSKTHIWCASNKEGKLAFNVADAIPGYLVIVYDGTGVQVDKKTLDAAGAVSFENLAVGGYRTVAQDKNGCGKEIIQNIDGNHILPQLDIVGSECRRYINPDDVKKYGGSATIKAIGDSFGADATYYFKKGTGLLTEPIEPNDDLGSDGYYKFTPGVSRKVSNLSGLKYSFIYKVVEARGTCEEEVPFYIDVKPENDFYANADPDTTVCINSTVTMRGSIWGTDAAKAQRYWMQWTILPDSRINVDYSRTLEKDFKDSFNKSVTINRSKLGQDETRLNMVKPYVLRVESTNNLCYDADTAHVNVYEYYDPKFGNPKVKSVDDDGHYFVRIPVGGTQQLELGKGNKYFERKYELVWNPLKADWLTIDSNIPERVTISDNFGDKVDLSGVITYKVKDDTQTCTESVGLVLNHLSTIDPPNAFTPNGDGYNDTWRVIYDEEMKDYPNLEVEVYNRWGSLVYHAKPYKNDWNGRYNGTDLPIGTYYYVIKLHRGNLPNISGAVSIIR